MSLRHMQILRTNMIIQKTAIPTAIEVMLRGLRPGSKDAARNMRSGADLGSHPYVRTRGVLDNRELVTAGLTGRNTLRIKLRHPFIPKRPP